ncbi:MAG TPA: OmpA family protein, partial [Caldimonas sp.]
MTLQRRLGAILMLLAAAAITGGCAGVGGGGAGAPSVGAPGGIGPGWSQRMEDRRAALERAVRGSGAEVSRTTDNQLRLVVPNDISFDPNAFALKPRLRSLLDPLAGLLAGDRSAQLTVVAHTDRTGSDTFNNTLSLDRAQSVRDYLVGRGVSATQIRAVGRGAREPAADNSSEAG